MINNPNELLVQLEEEISMNETEIEIIEAAEESNPENVSDLDIAVAEAYTEINNILLDLADKIESEMDSVETDAVEEANA